MIASLLRSKHFKSVLCRTGLLVLGGILAAGSRAGAYELASPSETANGAFGAGVAGVPDVTGDGISDIVVGAPGNQPGLSPSQSGRAFIFDGTTGQLLRTLDSPNKQRNGRFGKAVSGVADLDGDGFGDVIVGAPGETSPVTLVDSGRVYVFSGRTGALIRVIDSPVPGFAGQFGAAVSGTRDATGDGRGDIVVGAPFEELPPSPNNSGRAYVFDGATGVVVHAWAAFNPGFGDGRFGFSVAGLADVNGDLRTDVLVGAPQEEAGLSPNNAGRAYILDGQTGALIWTLVSPAEFFGGKFGTSVSSMPDRSGDGIEDCLVGEEFGAGGTGLPPNGPGQVFAFDPVTSAVSIVYNSPAPVPLGRFGSAVSGVRDLSGDGLGDVVVGAITEPGGVATSPGAAASFNGATGFLRNPYPAQNPAISGSFGVSVGGLDDLDGDLRGDIIIGASGETSGSSPAAAGRAYVYSGGTGGPLTRSPLVPPIQTCYRDPVGDTAGYLVGGGWGQPPRINPPLVDPEIDMSRFCVSNDCGTVTFDIDLGVFGGSNPVPHAQIALDLPITSGPVVVPGKDWYDPNGVMLASGIGRTAEFGYDVLLVTDVQSGQLYAILGAAGIPALVPGGTSAFLPGLGGPSRLTVTLPWAVLGSLFLPAEPAPPYGMILAMSVMTAHSAPSIATGLTGAPATDPDDVLSNFATDVEIENDLSTDWQVYHILGRPCASPTPTESPTETATESPTPTETPTPSPSSTPLVTTPTPSPSPTVVVTATPSPTPTVLTTVTPPASATPSPTATPTASIGFELPGYTVRESDGTVAIKIILQGTPLFGGPVTVNFVPANGTATRPSDYLGVPLVVTFNPGDTEQVINIPIVNDLIPEDVEYFTVSLSGPSGADLTLQVTTVTILDDDDPFGVRETVAAYPGEGRDPGQFGKIAHDSYGNLHVAYWEAERQDLKYAFGLRNPATLEVLWSIQTVDFAGDVGQYLDIAVDLNNQPVITYHDATNGSLKVAYDRNGDGDFEQNGAVFGVDDNTGKAEIFTLDSTSPRTGLWTSVTCDQTNRLHVSYQDRFNGDLKYATYSGTSWAFDLVKFGTPRVGAYSSIVVDNRNIGNGYVLPYIFYQDDYALEIRMARRHPVFGWQDLGTVDDDGDTGLYIDATITDDNTRLYVAYQDALTTQPGYSRARLLNYSDTLGLSVEEVRACTATGLDPCQLEYLFGDWGYFTSVATDRNGFAQVAHYDNQHGNLIIDRRTTDSLAPLTPLESTWEPRRRSDTIGDVGLFTSSDHHLMSLPTGDHDLISTTFYDYSHKAFRMVTADNDVLTSERAVYIDGAKVGEYSSIALDSNQHSFIAYYDNPRGALMIKGKQGPPENPFGSPLLIDDSSASRARAGDALGNDNPKVSRSDFSQTGLFVSMVIDSNDRAHTAYYDRLRRELNCSVTDLRTSTTQRIDVDTGPGKGQFSQIVMSPSGGQYAIAYYQEFDPSAPNTDPIGPGPRLRVAIGDGFTSGGWNIESVDNQGDVGRHCSITYDSSGGLHVAYHDTSNLSLKYATRSSLVTGAWTTETVDLDPNFNVVGYYTSIAINPVTGEPAIAYYDLTSARLKYAEKINGAWQIQVIDEIGDVGKMPVLKFDTARRLAYILYYDETFEALKITARPFGASTFQYFSTIDQNGAGAEPSLVIDAAGRIRMSYYDVKNGDLIYRHSLASLFSSVPDEWSQYE